MNFRSKFSTITSQRTLNLWSFPQENPSTLLRFSARLALICIAKRELEFSGWKRGCRGPVLLAVFPPTAAAEQLGFKRQRFLDKHLTAALSFKLGQKRWSPAMGARAEQVIEEQQEN